jgi:hypothetical protein
MQTSKSFVTNPIIYPWQRQSKVKICKIRMYFNHQLLRFQVLTAASMNKTVFWDALWSLVETDWRFRGAYCLYHHRSGDEFLFAVAAFMYTCTSLSFLILSEPPIIVLMMEAASTSETLVNFYQTTWHDNPEDSHLHTRRCENLKSHTNFHTIISTNIVPNVVVITPSSYSAGPGLECRCGDGFL